METYENIKFLREKLGLSQEELAERIGYKDRSSIAKVESGIVDLPQSKIALFAKALNVSPGELMGIEARYNINNNLQRIRLRANKSQQAVADYLGITRQAYSHYEVGRRKPDYETLLRLAEFFDVSVLDFKGAPSESAERAISDDDIKFALFGGDGEITDAMYDEVRNFAAFVKQREAQKKKE